MINFNILYMSHKFKYHQIARTYFIFKISMQSRKLTFPSRHIGLAITLFVLEFRSYKPTLAATAFFIPNKEFSLL